MRDISGKTVPKDFVYKDTVVIGNGPSGICLSFMLSGHWPYWNTEKVKSHPDELLRARLNYVDQSKSLVMQDLMMLADGLEGRSTNPVSLLLDSLQNPCADMGMELPSMLNYKYHPDKKVDHVVLGKGPPGGSWHRMDPNLRTLSLSAWMSLPGLDYGTWEAAHSSIVTATPNTNALCRQNTTTSTRSNKLECRKCVELRERHHHHLNHLPQYQKIGLFPPLLRTNEPPPLLCGRCSKDGAATTVGREQTKFDYNSTAISGQAPDNTSSSKGNVLQLPKRNLSLQRQVSKEVQTRALVSRVAEYYESYVNEMNLTRNFVNDTIVTAIQPLHCLGTGRPEARWVVYGNHTVSNKPFTYVCRNVVLANGASDLPNRLGLRAESVGVPWIKHELPQLEVALEKLSAVERSKMKPIMVVGAGLSAADAVTICRSSQVPVIHVYRNRSAGLDKMLPENVYPEYHAVHKMMKESSITYELYTPLSEHTIIDVSSQSSNGAHHLVTVQHLKTGETRTLEVSYCAILIGSRPDLRFLANIACKQHLQPETIINNNNNMEDYSNAVENNNNNYKKNQTINNNNTFTNNMHNLSQLANVVDDNNDEQWSVLSRKIMWLKNLCVKCKHLNFCEWSRRNSYKKFCGHTTTKHCECQRQQQTIVGMTGATTVPLLLSSPQPPPSLVMTNGHERRTKILTDEHLSTLGLGEDPFKPIDCKTNPIAVNKFTNEVLETARGLYSMGPLVGDNFVRFIPGGALAITSALHREND